MLLDLNPGGFVSMKSWRGLWALVVRPDGTCVAADDRGGAHIVDPRAPARAAASRQLHAVGQKVTSLSLHPRAPEALLSASNDHSVRVWDLRALRDLAPVSVRARGRGAMRCDWSRAWAWAWARARAARRSAAAACADSTGRRRRRTRA